MTTAPQWKRDARRIRELLETAETLAQFDRPQQTADAITCQQQIAKLLETWQNVTRANLATLNYQADAQRRNPKLSGTPKQCPTCLHHYPAYLFRPVHHDVMGDPRTVLIVCPKCERHALPNE